MLGGIELAFDVRVGGISNYDFIPKLPAATEEKEVVNPFSTFFNAALDLVKDTNQIQLVAEQWQLELATGQTDDLLSVLLAQDRAYNSLNFTVQVTNKIIESYREIMRMQI